jgi:flagellar hook-associated protein 2
MSTTGINFSGLGSGIDINSIITQMMSIAQQPLNTLKQQQTDIQNKQVAVNQVSASLTAFQSAAQTLDNLNSFSIVNATSSNTSAASVTADNTAQPGNHNIQVLQLAQSERVGSTALSSQTNPLNVSGQIVINGKAINVGSSDSLQTLVSNINSAQAGVNASIIATSSNSYTMVLTSANSGTANTISLSDANGGTILQNTLGMINGATTVNTQNNAVVSNVYTDAATSIGTLMGLTAPPAGTVTINGTGISLDLSTDSLSTIAQKINAANITGVSANLVSVQNPSNGATNQQLQLTGVTSMTDSNNILTGMGLLQSTPTTTLQTAKNANFTIDGLSVTRSSNTVTDVLSGVTLNLLQDSGQPTTNVIISPDINTISTNISNFVSQYNQLASTIANVDSYDPQTQVTGPLFGDANIQNVMDTVTSIITGPVAGVSGAYSMLSQIGITLDQTGNLNINQAQLTQALQSNLPAVAKIFQSIGTSTDSSVAYVSATSKTMPSGSNGYAVNITQAAAQASLQAGTAHTANNNPNTEILTFTGPQLTAGHSVFLSPNSTLDGIVSQINADPTIGNMVTATNNNGTLMLTAKQFGSNYSFSVVSSEAAASNNSGIGNTSVNANGLDVQGTINGEAATGSGQLLTGNAGNANTDGLQLRIMSSIIGAHGSVVYSQGLADQIKNFAQSSTDFLTGSLTQYSNSLGDQITQIGDQMTQMQADLTSQQTYLQQEFTAMDSAVASLKAASSALSALGVTTTSTSSTSSTSSTTGQ